MKWPVVSLVLSLLSTSCGLPGTTTWQERSKIKSVAMPAESLQKVVVTGSVISIIRNPFTGVYKGLNMFKSRGAIVADPWLKYLPNHSKQYNEFTIDQALDAEGYPRPIPGNVDFLIDGESFFNSLNRSVTEAKRSVDTQIFIFDNDDVAADYADLLKKKSKHVKCRVLLDHLGSIASWWAEPDTPIHKDHQPPASMVDYLKNDGRVKVRVSRNPWLVADHTKLIVIDGKTAYLGGMNIGREYRYEWHDMMMKVRGPVVTALQNNFNKSWKLQGGFGDWGIPFHRSLKYRKTPVKGEIGVRVLLTKSGKSDIRNAMLTAIRMSQKRIYLHVSYFTSDVFLRELLNAQARGVDVRMVFPMKIDSPLLHTSNQAAAKKLIRAGAKVYLYPKASHMKAIVIDEWACVGSANMDALSLRINDELNIAFSDKKTVNRLIRDLFEKDFKQSKLLKREDTAGWSVSPPAELIADQL